MAKMDGLMGYELTSATLPPPNEIQQALIDSFVRDLEKELNVTHEKISIRDTWISSPPAESEFAAIEDLMEDVRES